jgi:hypothetical protein
MHDEDRKKPDELQILLYFNQKEKEEKKAKQGQQHLIGFFKVDAVHGAVLSVTPN